MSHAALPPGPALPALAQQIAWILRPTAVLDACARRFGEAFSLRFPGYAELVILSGPEAIREVFTADPTIVTARGINAELEPLLGPRSPLLLEGAAHARQRRLVRAALAPEGMEAHAAQIREITLDAAARLPTGRPFALMPTLQAITLEVILRVVFGLDNDAERARLRDLLTRLLSLGTNLLLLFRGLQRDFGPASPWGRVLALRDEVDQIIYAAIARRRAARAPERGDTLSRLASLRDEEGAPMPEAELRDILLTLLVAGHETTTAALAWAFGHLLQRPEELAAIDAERARVCGRAPLEGCHVPALARLEAAVLETLRVSPVVPLIGRTLAAPARIGDRTLSAGVMVFPCVYLAQRAAARFPAPERFLPERFVGARPSPYAYFPFGGGARRCPGAAFAVYEMKVVLSEILSRFPMRLAPGDRQDASRRALLLAPRDGTRVIVL